MGVGTGSLYELRGGGWSDTVGLGSIWARVMSKNRREKSESCLSTMTGLRLSIGGSTGWALLVIGASVMTVLFPSRATPAWI